MNKHTTLLKELAKSIVNNGNIDKKTLAYIENNLSRGETRTLLKFLKVELSKQTVTITSAGNLPADVKKQFEQDYQGKRIVFADDESFGAGMKVKIGDNVYDYSFRNYIDQTIEKLRE